MKGDHSELQELPSLSIESLIRNYPSELLQEDCSKGSQTFLYFEFLTTRPASYLLVEASKKGPLAPFNCPHKLGSAANDVIAILSILVCFMKKK